MGCEYSASSFLICKTCAEWNLSSSNLSCKSLRHGVNFVRCKSILTDFIAVKSLTAVLESKSFFLVIRTSRINFEISGAELIWLIAENMRERAKSSLETKNLIRIDMVMF